MDGHALGPPDLPVARVGGPLGVRTWALKQVDNSPVVFGIYSGDVNQDGAVDITDVIAIFNDANSLTSGYVKTDVNGDRMTDVTDIIITFNNAKNIVMKITP